MTHCKAPLSSALWRSRTGSCTAMAQSPARSRSRPPKTPLLPLWRPWTRPVQEARSLPSETEPASVRWAAPWSFRFFTTICCTTNSAPRSVPRSKNGFAPTSRIPSNPAAPMTENGLTTRPTTRVTTARTERTPEPIGCPTSFSRDASAQTSWRWSCVTRSSFERSGPCPEAGWPYHPAGSARW